MKSSSPSQAACFAVLVLAALVGCSRKTEEASRAGSAVAPEAKAPAIAAAKEPGRDVSAAPRISADDLPAQIKAVLDITGPGRRQALEDLAGALAQYDPQRAADLVKRILAEQGEGGRDVHALVSGFMSDYSARNPAAAAAWAEILPLNLKFDAFTFVAREWAKTDLPAATAWAEAISDLSLRSSALRRISERLAESAEPQEVAGWARRLASSTDASHHTELIGRLWAKGDLQGAFQWAAQVEDPVRRTSAVVAVAGVVAEQNPGAAISWVEKFPPGELRNEAISVTALKWSESDPEAATRWIHGLGDQQMMETSMPTIARRWMQKEPVKAAGWIQSAPLPKRTKEYLLNRPGQGGD